MMLMIVTMMLMIVTMKLMIVTMMVIIVTQIVMIVTMMVMMVMIVIIVTVTMIMKDNGNDYYLLHLGGLLLPAQSSHFVPEAVLSDLRPGPGTSAGSTSNTFTLFV